MLHNEWIAFVREKRNSSSYVCDVIELKEKENSHILQRFQEAKANATQEKGPFLPKKYICHIPRGKLFPLMYRVEKVKYSRTSIARTPLEP